MKAEDAGLNFNGNARDVDIATTIARKLVRDAAVELMQMLSPLVPPGKTVCVSTTMCVLFKATLEVMTGIDREATNAFVLSVSDSLNRTGEDVQARQLAAQDALARAEIMNEEQDSGRGQA